ncbi:MAG: hypothetical protein AVDCRST_MAG93-635 [uncultured Chloroflexia bacterium]|uniref:Uncharacterized protein n=1 Tax=uncultured Chloroflexia bacterium TaxID=1672391 RepID=A0A6J4HJA7_9CHLR|nr:MAG: hypothetical protein AVDCRST_MAG93-635 [uncultured Chloroflexia bacterium]
MSAFCSPSRYSVAVSRDTCSRMLSRSSRIVSSSARRIAICVMVLLSGV